MELKDYEQPDDEFRYGIPTTVSDASQRLAQQRIEDSKPGIGEAWGMARDLESIKGASVNLAAEMAYDADPNYRLKDDNWEELTKDIPTEDQHIFGDARSAQHARWIREQYLSEIDKQQRLGTMGASGIALQFGAAIFDEGNLALALIPELAAVGGAHKLTRLQRALRVGAYSAAENAAVESYLQQASQTRGAEDIMYAALAGFALGAPIGAIRRGEAQATVQTDAEAEAMAEAARRAAEGLDRQVVDDITKDAEGGTKADQPDKESIYTDEDYVHSRRMLNNYEDALKYLQRGTDNLDDVPEELQDIVKKYQDDPEGLALELEMHRQELDEIEANFDRSTGAMQVDQSRVPDELRPDDQPTPEELNAPTTVFGKLRYDMVGRIMSSQNPLARFFGSKLAEDAVGHADGRIQKATASEYATRLQDTALTNVYRAAEPALKMWAKEQGLPFHTNLTNRSAFFTEVSRSIREGGTGNVHVDKVAQQMAAEFNELRRLASEANVKGFRGIEENPNYLPRLHNKQLINELNNKYGKGQMIDLIAGAIRRAQSDLDSDMVMKIARGYWSKIYKMANNHDTEFAHPISRESADFVRELLEEAGVHGDELEGMVESFLRTKPREGRVKYAKFRTGMDESFSMKLKDPAGRMVDVGIAELFENDAEKLFSHYARTVSGHIAVADKLGIRSKAEWETQKARINAHGHRIGMSQKDIDSDIKKLDTLYRGITGSPLETDANSTFARNARLLRDFNFVRIMNQVGFAQLAEIGTLLGTAGWRATLKHVPEIRNVYKTAKDGKLDDEFLAELEVIAPIGTDRLRNQVATRFDEHGFESYGKIDQTLQIGKRITGDISGMSWVNIALHRMASRAIAQKFLNTAMGKGGFSAKRLASYGLSEEDFGKISKMMKEHATLENSAFGKGKIRKLNFEDWTDPEAKQLFSDAMFRAGRKVIQANDIGNTHEFMHSTLGKIITQFRSFMLVAWSKQTLHALHMRDIEAFNSFMFSMAFGGLAYVAQTSVNYAGDSKELEKRLDPVTLAGSAFMRSGMASLIPAAVDTVAGYGDFEKVFGYGRSTGLGAGLIMGNPTADAVMKMGELPKLLSNVRSDRDFSQKQFRDLTSLMFFSNATGVRNVLGAIQDELPRQSDPTRQF